MKDDKVIDEKELKRLLIEMVENAELYFAYRDAVLAAFNRLTTERDGLKERLRLAEFANMYECSRSTALEQERELHAEGEAIAIQHNQQLLKENTELRQLSQTQATTITGQMESLIELKADHDRDSRMIREKTEEISTLQQRVEALSADLIASNLHLEAERESVLKCATKVADLKQRVEALEKERDEADRRAGASEREMEGLKETAFRRSMWLDNAKDQWGVDKNVSFDVVWAECLNLKQQLAAVTSEYTDFMKMTVGMPHWGKLKGWKQGQAGPDTYTTFDNATKSHVDCPLCDRLATHLEARELVKNDYKREKQ